MSKTGGQPDEPERDVRFDEPERDVRFDEMERDVRFDEMERDAAIALLQRSDVGRLAYSLRDQVDIVPVHYVLDDEWLFGRTSPGPKLDKLRRNWWVAFQVDEVDGPFDWRSVVVKGGFYPLLPGEGPEQAELYEHAVSSLRAKAPVIFTAQDPAPFRTVVFGIAIQEITGRSASTVSTA